MSFSHAVRTARFVCFSGMGLALSLTMGGCSHTRADLSGSSSSTAILAYTDTIASDMYAAIAPAAGESQVPLIEAVSGLAPEGKTFAFADDVNINMPVAVPDKARSRAERLESILASAGLVAVNRQAVVYIQPATKAVEGAAVPPVPQVRAKPALMNATMMNAPVVARGETPTSVSASVPAPIVVAKDPAEALPPETVTLASSPPPADTGPEVAPVVMQSEPMTAASPVSGDEVVLAHVSTPQNAPDVQAPSMPLAEEMIASSAPPSGSLPPETRLMPVPPANEPEPPEPVAPQVAALASAPAAPAADPAPAIPAALPVPPVVEPAPAAAAPTVIAPVDAPVPAQPPVVIETARAVVTDPTVMAAAEANDAAQLDASVGTASDVVMPPAQAMAGSWQADRGQTLRSVLEGWCARANVQLVWSTDFDYPLAASITLNETFEAAVRTLLTGFSSVSPQPVGRLHRQGNAGQRVLIIETRGNLYQDQ